MWLDRVQSEGLLQAGVVDDDFRAVSDGNDLVVTGGDGTERERLTFPRQRHDRHLCLADFFRPADSGETDVVGFQLVTVGPAISRATAELFAKNAYREYLELHGLSVQLTEALAEYWHGRIREETGLAGYDPADLDGILRVGYRGCRYSFGYPACPDLEDRAKIMRLLRPERIGVALSEEFQLEPEQSTDALITSTPRQGISPRDDAGQHDPAGSHVRHGRPAGGLRAAVVRGRGRDHGPDGQLLGPGRPAAPHRRLATRLTAYMQGKAAQSVPQEVIAGWLLRGGRTWSGPGACR